MRTLMLQIDGMACGGCARAVERALGRARGVRTARVSYEEGVARLLVDPDLTSIEALIGTVEEAGYAATRAGS